MQTTVTCRSHADRRIHKFLCVLFFASGCTITDRHTSYPTQLNMIWSFFLFREEIIVFVFVPYCFPLLIVHSWCFRHQSHLSLCTLLSVVLHYSCLSSWHGTTCHHIRWCDLHSNFSFHVYITYHLLRQDSTHSIDPYFTICKCLCIPPLVSFYSLAYQSTCISCVVSQSSLETR